ncbi:MAG: metalloregulator ArsR/SmtB family transcription factor [Thermomicrobiales bacterium]
MGELVIGRPALQVRTAFSIPLDMVSIMSLLYRAVPGSGLDRGLIEARRALPVPLQEDLDLLHGFSGRLLYYMEEPVMQFGPLAPEHLDAGIDDLQAYLEGLEPEAYRQMAVHALDRVHRDLGTELTAPVVEQEAAWRRYVEPGLTTADVEDVLRLLSDPIQLKRRTIRLIRGIWDEMYAHDYAMHGDRLHEAERAARASAGRGFGMAFGELTGNRLPATLTAALGNVASVTFCPSAHIGAFVSYISYPPDLVVFFSAQNVLQQDVVATGAVTLVSETVSDDTYGTVDLEDMPGDVLLEGLRALGDANRLRILDLLGGGELYAQEIVGRLGIAQSAVSRHLSQLERAGLVRVEPRRGMKYYAIDRNQLEVLAESIRMRAR